MLGFQFDQIGTVPSGKTLQGQITSLQTYSTGSITPKTGFTTNELWIKKIAGVVCINGYITATNAFGASQTEVGTLAEGYRPQYNVRMLVGLSDAAYNAPKNYAYLCIDSAGKVFITANSGNTYKICYFNASFVAYS